MKRRRWRCAMIETWKFISFEFDIGRSKKEGILINFILIVSTNYSVNKYSEDTQLALQTFNSPWLINYKISIGARIRKNRLIQDLNRRRFVSRRFFLFIFNALPYFCSSSSYIFPSTPNFLVIFKTLECFELWCCSFIKPLDE